MTYPFPDPPVTIAVVADEIARGGWTTATCPFCDGSSGASWHVNGADAVRYICATCQRFVLTGPATASLRRLVPDRSAEMKARLSRAAAAEAEPLTIDGSYVEAIGQAGHPN